MIKYPQANLLVIRKTYRTLKDSCFTELKWAIHRLHVDEWWEIKESPLEMTYKPTGQKIYFRGLDDPLKITSIIVYQMQYQQILKMQIDEALMDLQSTEYSSMKEYLENCYTNGAVGTFYDLHGQGVPVLFPIDQSQVAKAVQLDSKISVGLYTRLGEDINKLKSDIRSQVSRGIANGSTWNQTATEIAMGMKSPFNKAYNNAVRIARTEGHRIQNQAQADTLKKAKSKGADVVKQWDSTLDDVTRDTHKQLDGQIREIDQPFEVNGKTAMQPGGFGDPAEDCNCRCCMLQRAKWTLDESELRELQDRAEYFGLDKAESFENFKNKYLKSVANSSESGIINSGAISGALNPYSKQAQEHADRYYESVRHMTNDVQRIADNTGFRKEEIAKIKDFIFMQKHDLGGEYKYFDSSYEMAQTWQRLIDGKNIQQHDLTLLRHEKMESELMAQGYSQDEAHKITSKNMIMQGRLKHIMIRLTQIKKDKNNISCLALVEDCTIPFKLIYDIMSEEFQPYELPKSYEHCKSHIAHARRELERISKEEILPQERLIMWY